MKFRRVTTVLAAMAIAASGTLFASSPASAAEPPFEHECGKTYESTPKAGGVKRGKSHYRVTCQTLAGNMKRWIFTGYLEDWNASDPYSISFETFIGGSATRCNTVLGMTKYFTVTGVGTKAEARTSVLFHA